MNYGAIILLTLLCSYILAYLPLGKLIETPLELVGIDLKYDFIANYNNRVLELHEKFGYKPDFQKPEVWKAWEPLVDEVINVHFAFFLPICFLVINFIHTYIVNSHKFRYRVLSVSATWTLSWIILLFFILTVALQLKPSQTILRNTLIYPGYLFEVQRLESFGKEHFADIHWSVQHSYSTANFHWMTYLNLIIAAILLFIILKRFLPYLTRIQYLSCPVCRQSVKIFDSWTCHKCGRPQGKAKYITTPCKFCWKSQDIVFCERCHNQLEM